MSQIISSAYFLNFLTISLALTGDYAGAQTLILIMGSQIWDIENPFGILSQGIYASFRKSLELFDTLFLVNKIVNKSPAVEFNTHRIVQPMIQHGRTRRALYATRDTNGAHHSEVTVVFPLDGDKVFLDLRLNEDLVVENHTLQYQEKGVTVKHKPKKEELDLCHYSGSVRGKPNSWVAVSTCDGVSGVIFDGQGMKYIEPAKGSEIQSQHYLYDHNDLNTRYNYGFYRGAKNNTKYVPEMMTTMAKRNNLKSSTHTHPANKSIRKIHPIKVRGMKVALSKKKVYRYVELVLVADNREFKANRKSIKKVHSQMIQIANIINSLYTPLNINIALVGVVVWNERDEILLSRSSLTTLNNFLIYREDTLLTAIPNDNAQLITRQKFTDEDVARAYMGKICTTNKSGGVTNKHSSVLGVVANTIAHELGHNFGMNHDDDEDCDCPDEDCIMTPYVTPVDPVHWSSCSLKSLKKSFEEGMDHCLHNKPRRLFKATTCGNGFIEPGEQCDCGIVPDGGTNPCHACCHPDTCMLRGNATCSAGTCCDLTKCRPHGLTFDRPSIKDLVCARYSPWKHPKGFKWHKSTHRKVG